MNFKERIKALKIPRLLIEAILVFGSVYLALILEADRSKDFEREKFIVQLEQLKRTIKSDSIYYDAMFGNEDYGYKTKANLFFVAVDSLKNLNYDLIRENFYKFQNLHGGVITPIPEQIAIIRDSYQDLIDDFDRLEKFNAYFRRYDRLAEFDRMSLDLNSDFWMDKAANYKLFGDHQHGPDLELFIHSQEFRLYAFRMSWLLRNYFMFGGWITEGYHSTDSLISDEIMYQKKAMRGIL